MPNIGEPLIAAGITATSFMCYAVRARSSSVLAPSVYRGDPKRRVIALTFDDGPSESTPLLLEILARQDVRATFFMCGQNVRRLPGVARQVAAAGHEIANHTDSHPHLHFHSQEFIYRELAAAQESITKTVGIAPRLFRAPYGVRWFGLRSAQRRLNLLGVMWTTIGKDWCWPLDRVAQRLIHGATNGAIFCLHDGRELKRAPDISATLGAVERTLPQLRDQGFQFEAVSQVLRGVEALER